MGWLLTVWLLTVPSTLYIVSNSVIYKKCKKCTSSALFESKSALFFESKSALQVHFLSQKVHFNCIFRATHTGLPTLAPPSHSFFIFPPVGRDPCEICVLPCSLFCLLLLFPRGRSPSRKLFACFAFCSLAYFAFLLLFSFPRGRSPSRPFSDQRLRV